MTDVTHRRTFVLEDTKNRDYRYIKAGLLRRGWQQVAFPRRQASEEGNSWNKGSKFGSCWVQRRGAMGVASVGLRVVPCPDLIWTLSHGRLQRLRGLGQAQVTNFFDRSSCLTTKAGLCRTLQSSRCWGSDGEGFDSPSLFFPRCFDLSDLAQVDEFKDDFRQTAAEAVLKVFRRFLRSYGPVSSTTNATQSALKNYSPNSSFRPVLAEHGGSAGGGSFDKVHSWILALALRACRRRLLEIAGWRDDQVGSWCTASRAERLRPQEWDSLLLYSYILRRAVQPSLSKTAILTSPETDKPPHHHDRPTCAAESDSRVLSYTSDKPEEQTSKGEKCFSLSCDRSTDDARRDRPHPTRVRPRGVQGLRCVPSTEQTNRTTKTGRFFRRPSSAPAPRRHEHAVSEGRCPSPDRGQTTATDSTFTSGTGDHGRRTLHAAPGVWGDEEYKELRNGLFKIWSPSGFARFEGFACPWGAYEDGDDTDHYLGGKRERAGGKKGHGPVPQLMAETAQLCVALEKKCPQWKMDGESNLWMLKPAGASRGQGVRLAWTLDQILYAQKTMGGRVVQKYVESPLLLRPRQPQPRPEQVPTEPVPTGTVPTEPVLTESVPTESVPTEAVLTKLVPTDSVQTKPLSSDPDPRRPSYRQCDRLDGSSAPGSRRRVLQSQGEIMNDDSKADVVGAIIRTAVPCLSRSDVKQKPKPFDGAAAEPLSLALRGVDKRNVSCFGGEAQRDIDVGFPSPGATKFDLRVWVLVTSWKPLESFWFDECYLRVCPQSFMLDEANFGNPDVHLTNLCARRPVDRALKASAPSHGFKQRRERRRPFSASHIKSRCSTNNRKGHDGRKHVGTGTPADDPAKNLPRKHLEDETGAFRGEWRVEKGGSEGFVASQADLIDTLGELDAGMRGWPPDGTGVLERYQRRARGERLWKCKVSPSIRRVIKSTLLAAHSHVRPRISSFQLFGFDVLLDQELTPWLLEVNMSPALSHSSKRQSGMIHSMCEGLLRLTVDRAFPRSPPQPSSSNVYDETPSFDGPEIVTDENGERGKRVSEGNLSHQPGRWRPLTAMRSPFRNIGQKRVALTSTRVAQNLDGRVTPPVEACLADPSSQVFTVRGRHLSRRGLVRAERGVRGAMAVKVLEDWWNSKVEECRRSRSRKSWAAAVISRWVVRLVTRRRQRAIRAKNKLSVRVRQRHLSVLILEHRRLAAVSEACVLVQTAWRARRLERLRRSKLLRRKTAVSLGSWARALHSQRRNKAAEVALDAALAGTKRCQKRKRKAAEIIARALKTACIRRRKSLLTPQPNSCKLCLLSVVPAAQILDKAAVVQTRAATTIQRARQNVVARSTDTNIRGASARILQQWFRTVLRNRKRRRALAAVVQRAWRRARQQRAHSVRRKKLHATDYGLHNVFGSAVVEEPHSRTDAAAAAKARGTNVAPWRAKPGVKAGDQRQEDVTYPHVNGRESDGERIVSGHASDSSSASISCSSCRTTSTKEGYPLEIISFEGNVCTGAPSISVDGVLCQATTAQEDWVVPALNPVEGNVASCCSGKDSVEERKSDEEGRTEEAPAATTVVSPSRKNTNSHDTRDWCHAEEARTARNSSLCSVGKAVDRTKRATAETRNHSAGILSLDLILCDIVDTEFQERGPRKTRKRQGQPGVQCPPQANRSRPTAVLGDKPRGQGGSKLPPYSTVGVQSIGSSRAPGGRVNLTVAQAQPNVKTSSSRRSCQRPHSRCQGSRFVEYAPLPQSSKTPGRSALGMELESGRGRDAPTGKSFHASRARALPGGGKRVKGEPKTRMRLPCPGGSNNNSTRSRKRVPRTGDSTRPGVAWGISRTCYNGESGALLQMLASLEG